MLENVNMALVWLIAMIVLLVVEGLVPGLISIWFALGALAALLAAALHAPLWLQLLWFIVVSVASLALTRPLVKKYVNSRVKPTNALRGTGAAAVAGKTWTARMEQEGQCAEVGEVLSILRIEGVKLIVRKK